jgi:putative endonuclease
MERFILVQRLISSRAFMSTRQGMGSAFTARYAVTRLVWYHPFMLVSEARDREYQMKKWRREWKIILFEQSNPDWDDLYPTLIESKPYRSRKPPG